MSAAPSRTHQQRMYGLARANAIRTYRAELKRNLAAGADPVPIILAPGPELETMKVLVFLMALPKVGMAKASRFLVTHRIASSKTLGGLSDRQRSCLADTLR